MHAKGVRVAMSACVGEAFVSGFPFSAVGDNLGRLFACARALT